MKEVFPEIRRFDPLGRDAEQFDVNLEKDGLPSDIIKKRNAIHTDDTFWGQIQQAAGRDDRSKEGPMFEIRSSTGGVCEVGNRWLFAYLATFREVNPYVMEIENYGVSLAISKAFWIELKKLHKRTRKPNFVIYNKTLDSRVAITERDWKRLCGSWSSDLNETDHSDIDSDEDFTSISDEPSPSNQPPVRTVSNLCHHGCLAQYCGICLF